jgi:hypothetical protein
MRMRTDRQRDPAATQQHDHDGPDARYAVAAINGEE